MVRIFDDTNITHVHGAVNPLDDIEVINLELIMADLQTVTKRLGTIEKDVKKGDKDAKREKEVLEKAVQVLETGRLLLPNSADDEVAILKLLGLITLKPILYVLNKKAGGYNFDEQSDERWYALMEFFEETNSRYVCVDANVEGELKELAKEDQEMFRREYGVLDNGVNDLIRAGYDMLGLITYFTTGEPETRAWTVKKGSTAPQAGAAIHGDFEKKFIRAEVIHCDDLLKEGGYAGVREKGLLRLEGKEYMVQDGDVIIFKI